MISLRLVRKSLISDLKIGHQRFLCTVSPQNEIEKYYRTQENDPIRHNLSHLGRLYTVRIIQI